MKVELETKMKRIFSLLEQEILDLIHIPIEQLTNLVGNSVQYCTIIDENQNESNYFVVNDNIAEIDFTDKGETGYIECHSKDDYERPVGAKFFIKQGDEEYKRGNTVNPSFWNILNKNNNYDSFFHRGHIIASAFGGDKKMPDTRNRGKLSQFIQTKWSNENDYGLNPYCQWHFEEKVTKAQKNSSVCLDSRLIYRNKADKIPIGIHLQAVTEEDSLFNVFLPNVDPDIKIDYKNCTFKLNR